MELGLNKLPWYAQVGAFLLVGGLALGAFWNWYVGPQSEVRAEKQIELERKQAEVEQAERDKVILSFKGGKIQTLVATDVASRGIDIGGISHVINFDMPNDTDSYIHRIGRTARAEAEGDAFTFFTPEEEDRVKEIEEAVGKTIPRCVIPGFQEATRQFNHPPPGRRPRDGKFRRRRTPARGEFRRKHPDPKNPKRAF